MKHFAPVQGGMEAAIQQVQAAIDAREGEIAGLRAQLQGCEREDKEMLLLQQVTAKEQQVVELLKEKNLLLQQQLPGESADRAPSLSAAAAIPCSLH